MTPQEFLKKQRDPAGLDEPADGAVTTRISELIDRRSPFARSQLVYRVVPASTTFTVEHSLRLSAEDQLFAIVIGAEGDVRVWKNPTDRQRPGVLTLRCSTASIPLDLLLFIPRP